MLYDTLTFDDVYDDIISSYNGDIALWLVDIIEQYECPYIADYGKMPMRIEVLENDNGSNVYNIVQYTEYHIWLGILETHNNIHAAIASLFDMQDVSDFRCRHVIKAYLSMLEIDNE